MALYRGFHPPITGSVGLVIVFGAPSLNSFSTQVCRAFSSTSNWCVFETQCLKMYAFCCYVISILLFLYICVYILFIISCNWRLVRCWNCKKKKKKKKTFSLIFTLFCVGENYFFMSTSTEKCAQVRLWVFQICNLLQNLFFGHRSASVSVWWHAFYLLIFWVIYSLVFLPTSEICHTYQTKFTIHICMVAKRGCTNRANVHTHQIV